MKIKFLCDHATAATPSEVFKAGQVVERDEASARHFMIRGLAVDASEPPAAKKTSRVRKADVDKDAGAEE